jgi:hypothetical protein
MRKFVLFAFLLTAFFIWLNRNDPTAPLAANNKSPVQSADRTASATPRSVYEHDWAKRSLNRASAVANQARQNQTESQPP